MSAIFKQKMLELNCVKSVQKRSFSWSVFEQLSRSVYSVL